MKKLDATITHDGDPPFTVVAEIRHRFVEDRHMFTSEDIPGLCVAARDVEAAKEHLRFVIRDLIRHNHGFDCTVELAGKGIPGGKGAPPPRYAIVKKAA